MLLLESICIVAFRIGSMNNYIINARKETFFYDNIISTTE